MVMLQFKGVRSNTAIIRNDFAFVKKKAGSKVTRPGGIYADCMDGLSYHIVDGVGHLNYYRLSFPAKPPDEVYGHINRHINKR
jgi:hypothetical protein